MGKMVCGWSCMTKGACVVHGDVLFSGMKETAFVRSYDAMTQSPRVIIPVSQAVLHRPRLPPIPEEDEEHMDGEICKVYSPKAASGVSITITNIIWRPHLPSIPEEKESSYDDDDDGSSKEDETVNRPRFFSGMREATFLRSYDAMTHSACVLIPVLQAVLHGPRLPPIPEEDEEYEDGDNDKKVVLHRPRLPPIPEEDDEHEDGDNDKEVVPGLDETEIWAMHLCPTVLAMSDGVEREGAVNDKSSECGGVMRKVYGPKAAGGVSVTITNVMWRPHLPPIPEEEESSYYDDNDGSRKEDETVNRGTAAGASDYVEAIKEVLALMASSGAHRPTSARDAMLGLRLPQILEESVEEMGASHAKSGSCEGDWDEVQALMSISDASYLTFDTDLSAIYSPSGILMSDKVEKCGRSVTRFRRTG